MGQARPSYFVAAVATCGTAGLRVSGPRGKGQPGTSRRVAPSPYLTRQLVRHVHRKVRLTRKNLRHSARQNLPLGSSRLLQVTRSPIFTRSVRWQ